MIVLPIPAFVDPPPLSFFLGTVVLILTGTSLNGSTRSGFRINPNWMSFHRAGNLSRLRDRFLGHWKHDIDGYSPIGALFRRHGCVQQL